MKLLRLEIAGQVVPCLLDATGKARDVRGVVADFTPDTAAGLQAALQGIPPDTLPEVAQDGARLLPPLAQPRNIWCIGLNYSDHAAEAGLPVPPEPILFSPRMTKLDWEVELGVVIGTGGMDIPQDTAIDHVLGYTVVNDVSERAWQMEHGGQWVKGKSFPNFCPTGPWIVTPDEVDAADLPMWLDVNGVRMQTGRTSKMVFDVATVVSYLSRFCMLLPGDLICTGTPPGVGMGMKPPRYLAPGDVVTLGIDGLGQQRQTVTVYPG